MASCSVVCMCGVQVWCACVVCMCAGVVCRWGVQVWCAHVVCTCGVQVWCAGSKVGREKGWEWPPLLTAGQRALYLPEGFHFGTAGGNVAATCGGGDTCSCTCVGGGGGTHVHVGGGGGGGTHVLVQVYKQ